DRRDLGAEEARIDDYTITITQSAPNKLFLPVLAIFALMIYDKETMEANATEDDPWSHAYANTVNAPGFGPYCLESWEKEESFTLKANPNYHGGKPFYDRVLIRKVPESSNRLAILRSGQAKIVEALTPKEFQSLRKAKGIKVGGAYTNSTLTLSLNWETAPFDNIKLRKAIAHAIPYEQIINNVYFGDAKKWDGVIPSIYPGYHQAKTKYNYDPEKAKALLAEAGFPNGEGLEAFADSFKIAFVSERESILGPAVTIMRTALREIGIPAELDPMPLSQYSDRQFVKKDLPMAINDTSRPFGVDAAYSVFLNFVTVSKGGINNWGNYSNDTVDGLYEKAKVEPDTDKRNAFLADVQEILMEEVAWISIVEFKTQFAWREELTGVTLHPEGQLRFVDLKE
ncbi:MAG: ABC transporter substrate-binding protein, partial [Proteobacteria bacterium]|nr:ABC transporter substrate-binding protein [Pseudomonadota bacterium]